MISRGFAAALAGIAITVLAWYGPWGWPAWPAFAVLELTFGNRVDWLELSLTARGFVIAGLIAINVTFWGALTYLVTISIHALRSSSLLHRLRNNTPR